MADRDEAGERARERKARAAEQLRANLARRKAQMRSRRAGGADERPEGVAVDTGTPGTPGTGPSET